MSSSSPWAGALIFGIVIFTSIAVYALIRAVERRR